MAEPRWLDDEEMCIWRGFVEVAATVVQQLDASLKADADMGFDDYEVLVHLSEATDQRLRMAELSERLFHSRSRLSQRIDRLVDRGWVVRERCDEDRRGTFAVLTPAGWDAIEAAAPGHLDDVRRHLVDLIEPDERPVVAAVFARIAEHVRPSTDGARAGS